MPFSQNSVYTKPMRMKTLVDWTWDILPEALRMGRASEQDSHTAKARETGPTGRERQMKGNPEERHRVADHC